MKTLRTLTIITLLLSIHPVSLFSQPIIDQNSIQSSEKIYEPNEVDQKARITKKPQPRYTESARNRGVSGNVILRVVLRSSGEIGDIIVVKGLRDGLNEECIRVARQMRFEPAVKDGHPVSQYAKADTHLESIRFDYHFLATRRPSLFVSGLVVY
jgi:TonB family protein